MPPFSISASSAAITLWEIASEPARSAACALYVRGRAYLAMHKPEEAAAEFGRPLAHPGLALGDPVDAAARRQLARALELAGDKAKTRSAYQDLLTSWKDSDHDPEIPIFAQARAEYAKLQ